MLMCAQALYIQLSLKVSLRLLNSLWFKTQFSCATFVQGNTLVISLHTGVLGGYCQQLSLRAVTHTLLCQLPTSPHSETISQIPEKKKLEWHKYYCPSGKSCICGSIALPVSCFIQCHVFVASSCSQEAEQHPPLSPCWCWLFCAAGSQQWSWVQALPAFPSCALPCDVQLSTQTCASFFCNCLSVLSFKQFLLPLKALVVVW